MFTLLCFCNNSKHKQQTLIFCVFQHKPVGKSNSTLTQSIYIGTCVTSTIMRYSYLYLCYKYNHEILVLEHFPVNFGGKYLLYYSLIILVISNLLKTDSDSWRITEDNLKIWASTLLYVFIWNNIDLTELQD